MPSAWRAPLAQLALAIVAIVALSWADWADMAYQWWEISTYNHVLLVPFVLAWLVWQRREVLADLVPRAWLPGLVIVAGALFLWLLGTVSGVNLARQLGAVVAMQGAIIALFGPRVVAALWFPLCYMLFLVPFGDELIPALQMITAKITIALTHFSGIPAEIEGVFIDTPAGLFEVAEACSGVKFLIAMIALGTLAAHVCFETWPRLIAFMIASAIIPIIANGIRAWGTIYIAQFAGVEFASGFDHIFYGWVFFAIVVAMLLGLGWKFFDRDPNAPFVSLEQIDRSLLVKRISRAFGNPLATLGAVVAMCAGFALWAAGMASLSAPMPQRIDLPPVQGWLRVDYRPEVWWEPRATGARHRLLGEYADEEGHRVTVFYALYASQDEGHEAGGFGQGAFTPDTAWRWLEYGPAIASGQADRLLANGRTGRLAVTFYKDDNMLSGSNAELRLSTMRSRLLMQEQPTMMLILSAEEGRVVPARESIEAFLSSVGPLGPWMDHIAKGR